ncbi:conjugal transfer protein TraG, partial [Veillonellaceae bacterium M2-8]|nr:conjugal transfer protein TraG [Veillonellaceae bacterium M2-8]
QHLTFISFTLSGLSSLEKSYQSNPLAYKENLSKADRDKLGEFIDAVESAISIMKNIKGETIYTLSKSDIVEYVLRYVNAFHDDAG